MNAREKTGPTAPDGNTPRLADPSAAGDVLRANQRQADEWNGEAGRAWIEAQALLDSIYQPVVNAILAKCPPKSGDRVLDLGCGTGALTIAYARLLDRGPACIGVDIASSMIQAARERGRIEKSNVEFVEADAQCHPFEHSSFDLLVSRFGVMFFADPLRAFENLRRASKRSAKACFAVWRSPDDNTFMREAEIAASPFLRPVPALDVSAPGRFAWSEPNTIREIMEQSGWRRVEILGADFPCSFPLKDLDQMITRFGRIGASYRTLDEDSQSKLKALVRPVFSKHIRGEEVHFTAGCWIVTACASASV
jgi:ubiquinone/menaquinone biosynthesis C-methylase UbiE